MATELITFARIIHTKYKEICEMIVTNAKEIEPLWEGIIYSPKQVAHTHIDLTVEGIYQTRSKGALDFGGSEYKASDLKKLEPRIEDDPKYGWWDLTKGNYLIKYNEKFNDQSHIAMVFPHQRLLQTGCIHPAFILPSEESKEAVTILSVPKKGVRIKQNARISTAITYLIK